MPGTFVFVVLKLSWIYKKYCGTKKQKLIKYFEFKIHVFYTRSGEQLLLKWDVHNYVVCKIINLLNDLNK